MKLMLINDFRETFHKLWSVRFGVAAGLLSGIEVILPNLPMIQDLIPRGTFGLLSFVLTIAAVIARAVAQPKLTNT